MALDTKETQNSLFGGLKKKKEETPAVKIKSEAPTESESQPKGSSVTVKESKAKWQQLDKVTVLLTTEQKEGLDRVAKKLMKFRSNQLKGIEEKERITANTILRSLIDNFLEQEDVLQLETLTSEKEVREWTSKVFKRLEKG
jgi:hypothetical protein